MRTLSYHRSKERSYQIEARHRGPGIRVHSPRGHNHTSSLSNWLKGIPESKGLQPERRSSTLNKLTVQERKEKPQVSAFRNPNDNLVAILVSGTTQKTLPSVTESKAKEPWEMTQEEWKISQGYEPFWMFRDYSPSQWATMSQRTRDQIQKRNDAEFEKNANILSEHREAVLKAFFAAKPVPERVLRDYRRDIQESESHARQQLRERS